LSSKRRRANFHFRPAPSRRLLPRDLRYLSLLCLSIRNFVQLKDLFGTPPCLDKFPGTGSRTSFPRSLFHQAVSLSRCTMKPQARPDSPDPDIAFFNETRRRNSARTASAARDEDSAGDTTRKRTGASVLFYGWRGEGREIPREVTGFRFARGAGLFASRSRDESSPEIPRCHSAVSPRLTTSVHNPLGAKGLTRSEAQSPRKSGPRGSD